MKIPQMTQLCRVIVVIDNCLSCLLYVHTVPMFMDTAQCTEERGRSQKVEIFTILAEIFLKINKIVKLMGLK